MNPSELSWNLAGFKSAGVEAPDRVREFPDMCEGELMTNDEVEEFIKDSIAALRILADKQSPHLGSVSSGFKNDMATLHELGRIDQDEYNGLIDDINLRF